MNKVVAMKADNPQDEVTIVRLLGVNYHISSASVNKSGAFNIGVTQTSTYEMSNGTEMDLTSSYTEKCTWFPHPDLVDAFKMLRSHLAFFSEIPEAKGKSLVELEEEFTVNINKEKVSPLDRIYVTGFISDGISVTLTGFKMLNRGKQMPLTPPSVKWNEDTAGVVPYEFPDELMHVLNHVREECLLYKKGKAAPSAADLFTQEDEDADEPE